MRKIITIEDACGDIAKSWGVTPQEVWEYMDKLTDAITGTVVYIAENEHRGVDNG